MADVHFQAEDADFLRELAETNLDVATAMAHVMDQVGWEVISYLRSLTGETRPPARAGESVRRAHPGHWADITSNLVNAYRFELTSAGRRLSWSEEGTRHGGVSGAIRFPLELVFFNGMEYAAALEARDGYWVLSGITDPGGPVERALKAALAALGGEARLE